MKIKRIVARDMRTAIRKVREELGPDAVILANRKVDQGVEIISALDYDAEKLYEQSDAAGPNEVTVSPAPVTPSSNKPGTAAASEYAQLAQDIHAENERQAHFQLAEDRVSIPETHHQHPTSSSSGHQAASLIKNASRTRAPEPPARKPSIQEGQPERLTDFMNDTGFAGKATSTNEVFEASLSGEKPARQDMLIQDLQHELKSLRGLMESQFSIFEWEGAARRHPVRVNLLNRLSDLGLDIDLAKQIVGQVNEERDPERAWRMALEILSRQLPVMDDEILNYGGVVALVGSTGVGKTTTVAKLAARYAMTHGQRNVAIVTTDNYRIGAHEQLLHYARILGVPMQTADNNEQLGRVLAGLMDRKLVLIDTAGMSQRDLRLSEQFATLKGSSPLIKSYLVMSATTDLNALDETVKAFSRVDLTGCIITKLDEASAIGAPMTVAIRHHLPVAYVGVGQRVPEDLQPARAHRLISRALNSGGSAQKAEELEPDVLAAKLRGARNNAHA
ncbi:MAG: flagellar biosynthesis protein FlhF [Gammaproteobacteria bacterium]|nr:flagellar biosynthesis protein FlhF [Gammaproteobacteria bacterium]